MALIENSDDTFVYSGSIDKKSSKCADKAGNPECRAFDCYRKRQYKTQKETEYRVSAVDKRIGKKAMMNP
jgi:hypothetical protein